MNGDIKTSPVNKLRSRIMADSYRYEALSEDQEEDRSDKVSRWKKKKCPIYPIALIILIIATLLLTGFILWDKHNKKSVDQPCLTEQCVMNSGSIIAMMNLSVDPCTDFYEYACGKWINNAIIPPDTSSYNTFYTSYEKINLITQQLLTEENGELNSEAVKKAKEFYQMCMNAEQIEKLGTTEVLKLINKLGSWTVTTDAVSGTWNNETWDLTTAISSSASLGIHPLLFMYVQQDSKNSSANIMQISQAGLTLRQREEYIKNAEKYKKGFLDFAIQYGRLLGADDSVTDKMNKLYDFEKSLAEIFVPKEELIDIEKTYHKITVADLQNMLNEQIDIKRYLDRITKSNISTSTKIIVTTPPYFRKLGLLLANTDREVLANYVVWNMLQALPAYLPGEFTNAALGLSKVESGVKDIAPRWKRCVGKTSNQLGFVTGALYVNKKFSKDNRKEVDEMLNNVKKAFINGLEDLTWMDEETKQIAIDKAKAVGNMIGFPDWILQPEKLDEYYENINITEGHFLLSHLALRSFDVMKNIEKLHKPPDRTEWEMSPDQVNAYYNPPNNDIVFPAGILQPPFYDPNMPIMIKYGSIGMVFGHELTHGFDNHGRKVDKYGNLKNWWSNSSAEQFTEKSKCMKDQYSKYSVDGTQLNGEYTLSENIADNGGIKFGYMAYKLSGHTSNIQLPGLADLSDDQLLFLGFAQAWCSLNTAQQTKLSIMSDVHSLHRYRIIGSLSNFPQFSSAFNCPANSPMNPGKKCTVW
ncbi:endothelin-converting enzyme 1-like isoform X2 [Patella vulgata]|uniref:endothelin-converting enzyme 1-like isoform X2 n=1 Tax=Patella vulgata TaxID=6465 RepID=UPI0024A914C3|nr:endothelin-converting enzyme 1-like isoform X2 [Patella vulgata]